MIRRVTLAAVVGTRPRKASGRDQSSPLFLPTGPPGPPLGAFPWPCAVNVYHPPVPLWIGSARALPRPLSSGLYPQGLGRGSAVWLGSLLGLDFVTT